MRKWIQILFNGFWIFIIGSIFGFLFEGFVEIFRHGAWVSRQGLLYGPISQVYGIGAVVLCALLSKIQKPLFLFITGAVIGGTVEYMLSLLQEYVFGTISWDYSNYIFNINGRTSLFHALMWGLITLLFIKFIYPLFIQFCTHIQNRIGYSITILLSILLTLDIFLSIAASIRQDERRHHIPPQNEFEIFLDKHYPDEFMNQIYDNKMYRWEK